MKKILFILIITTIFFSCKKNNEFVFRTLEYNPIDTFFIPINEDKKTDYIRHISNTENKIIISSNSFLYIYNFVDKKAQNTISLPYRYVNVFYHNQDSIFVLQDPYLTNLDSCVYLMNNAGVISKYYSIKNLTIVSDTVNILKSKYNQNLLKAVPYNNFIFVNNNLIFSLIPDHDNTIGGKELTSTLPLIGYINTKTNEWHTLDIYKYPLLSDNHDLEFAGGMFHQKITLLNKNKILLSFSYTPIFYEIDIDKNTYKEHKIKSFVLDTIPLTKEMSFTQPLYGAITYNNDLKIFFRAVYYARGKHKFGSLVFDEDFKAIGEFVPKQKHGSFFFQNGLVYFSDDNLSNDSLNIIAFTVNKFNFVEQDLDTWLAKYDLFEIKKEINKDCQIASEDIEEADMLPYLKKYISDSSYSVVIVPTEFACPGCIDYALMQYSVNQKPYFDAKIYMIAVGKEGENIELKLSEAFIDIQNKYIVIDSTADYFNYQKGYTNIHYLVVENKEIIFNRIYNAEELNDWASIDLENYFKTFEEQ